VSAKSAAATGDAKQADDSPRNGLSRLAALSSSSAASSTRQALGAGRFKRKDEVFVRFNAVEEADDGSVVDGVRLDNKLLKLLLVRVIFRVLLESLTHARSSAVSELECMLSSDTFRCAERTIEEAGTAG
jgi:hypothetical protein